MDKNHLESGNIENFLFDLGGVILDLSFEHTFEAFSRLSSFSVTEIEQLAAERLEFKQYETGKISDQEFREFIRASMNIKVSDETIDTAWNAMLVSIPESRLVTLQNLRKNYKIFLLSNTNGIHLRAFNAMVKSVSDHSSLDFCFHKVYYSHEIGMRKPDVEIFQHVLTSSNLQPDRTLFFDDLNLNVEGAQQAGLQTYHVTNADELFKELDKLK